MNIDKVDLETVWLARSDAKQYRKLLNYIDQMAVYFASRFKINLNDRDDILQEVRMSTIKVIDQYDPSRKSSAFSFFYKTIYIGSLYFLRKQNDKSKRSIKTCSYDIISNIVSDSDLYLDSPYENSENDLATPATQEDILIEVGGRYYLKDVILNAAVEAKNLYKKKNLDPLSIKDELVRLCYEKLQERTQKRRDKKIELHEIKSTDDYDYKSEFEDEYSREFA